MDIGREVERLYAKAFPEVLKAHGALYVRSGGRIGHKLLLGVPSLIVRTVGAKSGEPRTTVLTYVRDGDDYVVVASKGGAPRNPAWYHNLVKAGTVDVQVGTDRFPATVEALKPGDGDYQRLWDLADANNGGRYAAYQRKTKRPIPVVRLRPA
ncbi:nitroreductase family deazaflavin-dependent oxidoreductase [Tsukamurella asaccharolytica]|uniref:Nitroreductase family deazaflavin-dependent oxidoreductase n=1 Tax=Tsukamurella asaccharolytica TaxID=2592067 RepID=A0A5C5RBV9_9ACTN|nr:nitroreductase family deazaflavin-dependent oxidoreductase [Tsukamurella asaccharolytica]TWS19873.1 nitroreductase family deazaflavin-dependent oxidoreductase [Tsukamurella asaccharolytica]